jgi:hypothetical protein
VCRGYVVADSVTVVFGDGTEVTFQSAEAELAQAVAVGESRLSRLLEHTATRASVDTLGKSRAPFVGRGTVRNRRLHALPSFGRTNSTTTHSSAKALIKAAHAHRMEACDAWIAIIAQAEGNGPAYLGRIPLMTASLPEPKDAS